MKDIYIDPSTNDIVINNYDIRLTQSIQEYIAQKTDIVLSTFRGEWWLNEDLGIPYFQEIFIKNPNIPQIDSIYKAEIMGITGVQTIVNYKNEYNPQTRESLITFTEILDTGEKIEVQKYV